MNGSRKIPIRAVVNARERPIVQAAADHLAFALKEVTGDTWSCDCEYPANIGDLSDALTGSVIITTLSDILERLHTPWPEITDGLRKSYAGLSESGMPIMICTVFRHVDVASAPDQADLIRRRIRQLNLLVTELSRQYGAFVIDLDRILADIGARRLKTDYRLGGATALDIASLAIASNIAANALDDFASVDAQDKARAVLDRDRPAVGLAPEIKMTNVMVLGRGRRRQLVSTVTDSVEENHIVWQLRQVLARQISLSEAGGKLFQTIRRRGARESAALLLSGFSRLFRS